MTTEDDDPGEMIFDIDDPNVPEIVREHARCFRTPVSHVVLSGVDIVLLDEDGAIVDICALR